MQSQIYAETDAKFINTDKSGRRPGSIEFYCSGISKRSRNLKLSDLTLLSSCHIAPICNESTAARPCA